MRDGKILFWLMLLSFFVSAPDAYARSNPTDEGILVGRVSHVEGQLLRYVPEEKDWVATVKDTPFGLNDTLYSNEQGKAEFIMPNGTWARIGNSTQIQLIALENDLTQIDVASGVARINNRSHDTSIKAGTPFGYVVAPPGASFDLYVGDKSLEVIGLKGDVDFIPESGKTKYEVRPGSSSIISDGREVASGDGEADSDWDGWNNSRDRLWAGKLQVKSDSARHLPEPLADNAYALDDNGKWDRVYYDDGYHDFWRPVHVSPGWAPFTVGRWTYWYGDNCWVPDEPFGYVTHHYGNWVLINGVWYWAPPRPVARLGGTVGPGVGIGLSWYPGRVGWIHSGPHVGWVPLAPSEPYYSVRPWGPHVVVVNNINIRNANIDIKRYRYVDHAVIVNRDNLYRINNYRNVRITNINNTTIINNYHAAPVLNDAIISNYHSSPQKHLYTNAAVERKPHSMVINRIEHNQTNARQIQNIKGRDIRADVANMSSGRPLKENQANLPIPKITDKLVREHEADKPAADLKLQQKELKRKGLVSQQGLPGNQIQPQEKQRENLDATPLEHREINGRPKIADEERNIKSPRSHDPTSEQSHSDQQHLPGERQLSNPHDENQGLRSPRNRDLREQARPVETPKPRFDGERRDSKSLGEQNPERRDTRSPVHSKPQISDENMPGRSQDQSKHRPPESQTLQPRPQTQEQPKRVIQEQQLPQRRLETPPQPSPQTEEQSKRVREQLEQKRRLEETPHQAKPRVQEPKRDLIHQEQQQRHIEQRQPPQPQPKPKPQIEEVQRPAKVEPQRHIEQRQQPPAQPQPQPKPQIKEVQRPPKVEPTTHTAPSNKEKTSAENRKKQKEETGAQQPEQPVR